MYCAFENKCCILYTVNQNKKGTIESCENKKPKILVYIIGHPFSGPSIILK